MLAEARGNIVRPRISASYSFNKQQWHAGCPRITPAVALANIVECHSAEPRYLDAPSMRLVRGLLILVNRVLITFVRAWSPSLRRNMRRTKRRRRRATSTRQFVGSTMRVWHQRMAPDPVERYGESDDDRGID
jgi:hypothetical protein